MADATDQNTPDYGPCIELMCKMNSLEGELYEEFRGKMSTGGTVFQDWLVEQKIPKDWFKPLRSKVPKTSIVPSGDTATGAAPSPVDLNTDCSGGRTWKRIGARAGASGRSTSMVANISAMRANRPARKAHFDDPAGGCSVSE